jgi:hypothetical protein
VIGQVDATCHARVTAVDLHAHAEGGTGPPKSTSTDHGKRGCTGRVENGIFLQTDSLEGLDAGDEALPDSLKNYLKTIIADHPFSGFAFGYVRDLIESVAKYERTGSNPLIGLPGFEDAKSIAARVVDAFISLPWSYTFICPLGLKASYLTGAPETGAPEEDKEYVLGDAVSLVRRGPAFAAKYRIAKGGQTLEDLVMERYLRNQPTSWRSETLYLVRKASGFVNRAFDNELELMGSRMWYLRTARPWQRR